jgi:Protein of unknown function (DUF2693).
MRTTLITEINKHLKYIDMKTTDLSHIMKLAHQFIRTADISLSEALKQAWATFKLRQAMSKRIVKFYYCKVDGSIREAYGTLKETIIPTTQGNDRKKNETVMAYFDTEAQGWRSFKKLNLVSIV